MNTTNTKSPFVLTIASLSVLSMLIAACNPSDETSTSSETSKNVLATLILEEAPTNALSVFDARKQSKPGESIQVTGQIGGTLKPFIEGYAGFVLADPELEFCNEMGDDHCSTPWDACCEDTDKLQSMRIAVQLVDDDGNPIQADIKENIGIKELDEVTVVGTVADSSTDTNLLINATALYRK